MEFKELIEKRRSIRKFSDRAVPRETVDRILRETLDGAFGAQHPDHASHGGGRSGLGGPHGRNARLRVGVHEGCAAGFRRAGRYFEKRSLARKRRDFGHAAAARLRGRGTRLLLGAYQRPAAPQGVEPDGQSAADYLRSFLPVPADCEPLCAIAAGYSDFTPAPLPDADDAARIIRL